MSARSVAPNWTSRALAANELPEARLTFDGDITKSSTGVHTSRVGGGAVICSYRQTPPSAAAMYAALAEWPDLDGEDSTTHLRAGARLAPQRDRGPHRSPVHAPGGAGRRFGLEVLDRGARHRRVGERARHVGRVDAPDVQHRRASPGRAGVGGGAVPTGAASSVGWHGLRPPCADDRVRTTSRCSGRRRGRSGGVVDHQADPALLGRRRGVGQTRRHRGGQDGVVAPRRRRVASSPCLAPVTVAALRQRRDPRHADLVGVDEHGAEPERRQDPLQCLVGPRAVELEALAWDDARGRVDRASPATTSSVSRTAWPGRTSSSLSPRR